MLHKKKILDPVALENLVVRGVDEHGKVFAVDDFFVRSLKLEERLDDGYTLRLELVSEDVTLDVGALVGGRCRLQLRRGSFVRPFQGIVWRAKTIGIVNKRLRCSLEVVPALRTLELSKRTRVFQDMTAVQIVQSVAGEAFERYGARLDPSRLHSRQFRRRDFCVQYDETDLAFVRRLLAEEGLSYSFTHEGEGEALVLMDVLPALHSVAGEEVSEPRVVRVRSHSHLTAPHESVRSFTGSTRMRTANVEVSMWDWTTHPPTRIPAGEVPFDLDRDLADSPARFGERYRHGFYGPDGDRADQPFIDDADLAREASRVADRARLEDVRASGAGNVLGFTDGATFELTEHPTRELDGSYVVLSVTHTAEFDTGHEDGASRGQATTYSNTFKVFRASAPDGADRHNYAPARRPKPRARGPVTAVVTGPPGEEIHTDEHGRIQVWMHFDRDTEQRQGDTSCWIRVAHAWAGPGYGAMFIPRIGMEVVVSFIGDDPDRPMCTGVVWNGGNPPPFALPDDKTRSGIRTSSSPGGDGFNELSFEDAAGAEEIYLHAQRNLREVVKAAHSTSVGAGQALSVGKDRQKTVNGSETAWIVKDRHLRVEGVQGTHIVGSETTIVGCQGPKGEGDESVTIGTSELIVNGHRKVWADKDFKVHAGNNDGATMEASHNGSIHFQVPGAFQTIQAGRIDLAVGRTRITITDGKIEIVGAVIEAKSTGASLTMSTVVDMEGAEVNATGGTSSKLQLRGGSAAMTGATASVTSSKKTTVASGAECFVQGAHTTVKGGQCVAVTAPEVTTDGTTVSTVAKAEHVVKGLPVRIN